MKKIKKDNRVMYIRAAYVNVLVNRKLNIWKKSNESIELNKLSINYKQFTSLFTDYVI